MKMFAGPYTEFAQALDQRMDELGLNIADLHARLGDAVSYEHVRKITKGQAFPSATALRALCEVLELDFDKMKKLADEARVKEKYGDVVAEMTGRPRGLDRVAGLWKKLNREQRDTVIDLLQVMVKRNTTSAKEKAD